MSLDYQVRYSAGFLPGDANYPFGIPKNSTTETSEDGAPWDQDGIKDWHGFFQGLLSRNGITPSGNADTVNVSDYLDALGFEINKPFDELQQAVVSTNKTRMFDGAHFKIKDRTIGNGGGAIWDVVLASTVTPNTDNIVICTGIPTLALVLRIEKGTVTSSQFGLPPDTGTDYFANGQMDRWLQFLSNNEVTGVFVSGFYDTAMDQFYSNVSIYGEPGAIFAGTIHLAINTSLTQPALNRPRNVTWLGECASFERVGTFNCDDVYVEKIVIREDITKAASGIRGAGVHLFAGTNNMHVDDIFIEASERNAGLAIDHDPGDEQPKNITIVKCYIKKSYVHGVSIVADKVHIDTLILDEYGAGEVTDPNILFALSNTAASTTSAVGIAVDNSGQVTFGTINIDQNPSNPTAGNGANLFVGNVEADKIIIRNSVSVGFQNNTATVVVDDLDVGNGQAQGIFNKSSLACTSINANFNDLAGIENTTGSITANKIISNNNDLEGYIGAGHINCPELLLSVNNLVTKGFNCKFLAGASGWVNIESTKTASGNGGGVEFNGNLQKLTVGYIHGVNDSDTGGAQFASVSMVSPVGLTWIGGGLLSGDDGVNSFQPLRIISPTDLSINGLRILDDFNGNIVAGTIALVDRVGFMNCTNDAGTNILVATVSEFNTTGMSTP